MDTTPADSTGTDSGPGAGMDTTPGVNTGTDQ